MFTVDMRGPSICAAGRGALPVLRKPGGAAAEAARSAARTRSSHLHAAASAAEGSFFLQTKEDDTTLRVEPVHDAARQRERHLRHLQLPRSLRVQAVLEHRLRRIRAGRHACVRSRRARWPRPALPQAANSIAIRPAGRRLTLKLKVSNEHDEVKVPDIGDFEEVAVIEVLVKPGDTVKAEQSLITVESDKASMEIPSSHAGVVKSVAVKVGDKVSEGSVVLTLEAAEGAAAAPAPAAPPPGRAGAAPARRARTDGVELHRRGRPRMRPAGARRRPRRLFRRLPCGRPGPQGRAGRALRHAGRRLPQRRLHSFQGAAARRGGDGRGQAFRRPRRRLRRPGRSTAASCWRARTRWWASSPAAWPRWRRCAR